MIVLANTESKTITKTKQKAFLVLFNKLVAMKGSKNEAKRFIGINSSAIHKWEVHNQMTLRTAKMILDAWNRANR